MNFTLESVEIFPWNECKIEHDRWSCLITIYYQERKKRSLCCLMKHNTTQKENAKTDHFWTKTLNHLFLFFVFTSLWKTEWKRMNLILSTYLRVTLDSDCLDLNNFLVPILILSLKAKKTWASYLASGNFYPLVKRG